MNINTIGIALIVIGISMAILAPAQRFSQAPPRKPLGKQLPSTVKPIKQVIKPTKQAQSAQIALINAAKERGLRPGILLAISWFETARTFRTDIRPRRNGKPIGSAIGLCQFIKSTRVRYDLPRSNRKMLKTSANKQAEACARLTADNKRHLKNAFHREPSPGEIYLAHFLGAGKAVRIVLAKPRTPLSRLVSRKARKNNGILRRKKTAYRLRHWARLKMNEGMRRVEIYYGKHPAVAGWLSTVDDTIFFSMK